DFAEACDQAGIVFIGPPAAAISAMGLKSEAKTRMQKANVPLVPGYHGDRQEADFLQAQAARIGYPVLIKASAGGGGKGMRIVQRPEDFEAALASCQREALGSFGDERVLVERYLARPRHIEVQVFADTHGHTVHLFERDCSVQRRHQKVLEEAPAPGMSEACRQAMTDAAIAAARSVGYVGAGTVEFSAEHDVALSGRFYFMEMNTRLQVEHPVTEAITGHDLVEWQLRVAAGEPLPVTQAQLQIRGHAIEARLCAENPSQQFLPATGRLQVLRTPAASAFAVSEVRIDSGVREGDEISPHYDSMIAKLIVHGADRAQAQARLDAALAELHISGLQTNVAFVRRLARTRAFREADLDTALIEREHEALFGPATHDPSAPPWWPVAAAVARWLHEEAHSQATPTDPWAATDGWRLQGPGAQGRRWLDLLIEPAEAPVPQRLETLIEHRGEASWPWLHLAGEHRAFAALARGNDHFDLTLGEARQQVAVYP
ncbi:MAG TPA: ATP-grasp domain-containing protein, partial [Aquabacterium sp.]|nr:ATP-grasp domain-containing protein [Aquabacterium sp.]